MRDHKGHRFSITILAIGILCNGPASLAAVARAAPVVPRAAVQKLMSEGEVPGLSMALVDPGRIRESALGVKNIETGEPVESSTVFEAASLSKPVVAYAVMKLVDAGKIRLDAPVASYADGGVLDADPRWKKITIRMLLSHSSGLPNELEPGQQPKIDFEPGTRFSYSGLGYSFLQRAIENVTASGFESVMERLVFRPLGMRDSGFVWRPDYESRKAFGHNSIGKVNERRKPDAPKAPSSLNTTAADYAKFVRAVLNRTGLSSASWQAMTAVQSSVPSNCVVCIGKVPAAPNTAIGWGLGWAVEQTGGAKYLFHWGENNGDFHAFVIGDPRTRRGMVILTNSGNGMSIVPALVSRVFPQDHSAFAWMGYDQYDSPARVVQRRILQLGADTVLAGIETSGAPFLTELQWNRMGYELLGRRRAADAIRIFAFNVSRFPGSANAYDSLGEAYLAGGDKALALKSYRRSLELDSNNENARQMIAKLEQKAVR